MINRPELLALEFYKSRPFKGSDKGIRYMIQKDTVEIPSEAEKQEGDSAEESKPETKTVLTEPFCFEVTPDEKKGSKQFEFSEEGLCDAISWLNESHDEYAYKKQ